MADKPTTDCEVVACAPPSLALAAGQKMAPRLGRPEKGPPSEDDVSDVALVEVVSPSGPLTEELLERRREGRPGPACSTAHGPSTGAT
jgi:hypothetical protein